MNILAIFTASPLLWKLLYALLFIGGVGLIIYAIGEFIAPISPKVLSFIALILVVVAILYFLTGCADQNGNRTSHFTGRLSNQSRQALATTASGLALAAQVYQQIGEPGLPPQYKQLYDSLSSAAVQLQAQVGHPANPTAIVTGSQGVDLAILKNTVPGAIVTQADANTVFDAARLGKQ